MGAPEPLLPLILGYMRLWLPAAVLFMAAMVGLSAARAAGDARFQGIAMAGAALLNLALAPPATFGLGGFHGLDLVQTTSEDAGRSKLHSDIFQAVLKKLGAAPGDAVTVGDTPYDASAAVKAGTTPVGVLRGGFPADALRKAGCGVVRKAGGFAGASRRVAAEPIAAHMYGASASRAAVVRLSRHHRNAE